MGLHACLEVLNEDLWLVPGSLMIKSQYIHAVSAMTLKKVDSGARKGKWLLPYWHRKGTFALHRHSTVYYREFCILCQRIQIIGIVLSTW